MKFSNLLTNKYVLYLTLFLAISQYYRISSRIGDEESLIFFITIGVLSTFFSNNMIVVFLIAILSTNILFAGNVVKEGLETMKKKQKKRGQTRQKRGANAVLKRKNSHRKISPPANLHLLLKKRKMRRWVSE